MASRAFLWPPHVWSQSHHSGIETNQLAVIFWGHYISRNRTIVGLKREWLA